MISLREAKELVMDTPYFKRLEIFEIKESKEAWIFIINGIDNEGALLTKSSFIRLIDRKNGEIKQLSIADDKELIDSFTTIYSRTQTYIESKYYVKFCYDKYEISSAYESENYHKFVIRHKVIPSRLTILIDRHTYKIVDAKKTNLEDEEFILKEKKEE